jgi:LPS-assembly protein
LKFNSSIGDGYHRAARSLPLAALARPLTSVLLISLPLMLMPKAANAEQCATPRVGLQPLTAFSPALELGDSIELSADSAESAPDNPNDILLNGTISIRHRDGELKADNARYDPESNTATVDGELSYQAAGLRVHSSDALIDLGDGTFELGNSGYEVESGDVTSQGRADSIRRDGKGRLILDDASYSSCPPGNNGWRLFADDIKLDADEGIGTARSVTLRFRDIPIFYTPAISFPISDKRKTGFLAPRFDQNDQTGFEYRQPWYWNIRPNMDATFVLRSMTDRGFQFQSELRYLNRIGSWSLNYETIENDRRFSRSDARRFTRFQHLGSPATRWTTEIDLNYASDKDYFEDLGDTLKVSSITHLQRRADLIYESDNLLFRTRLLNYQTLDTNIEQDQRPYRLLPQLTLDYRQPVRRLGADFSVNSELVYFDRDNSITGTRLDFKPQLSWDVRRAGWYSKVASSWRLTHYDLNYVSAADQQQTRNVPLLSAETGLYLERPRRSDGSLLTLEPRLFYLYAARRDQDQIPIFDSGALDFNFSQLFRENRFSGADRINDANQLSFALSSRWINRNGREKYSASVGQIFYFSDRLVTLPDDPQEQNSSSDIVAELTTEITSQFDASLNLQWDPATTDTERSSAMLRYRGADGRLANLGHRYLPDDGEFVHASFTIPIGEKWRLASAWNYSLDDNKSIESVFGIEYDSCCYAVSAAARRYITDDGEDTTTSYFFQLVLKGLAPVGQNVTEVLSEAIGGYSR